MSAGYGVGRRPDGDLRGDGDVRFQTPRSSAGSETCVRNFVDNSAGIAFDSLELQVLIDGGTPRSTTSRASLARAALRILHRGSNRLRRYAPRASPSRSNISSATSPAHRPAGDGFSFAYELVDPPPRGAVPEPSTWAMMLVGFAGLGVASWRRGGRPDSPPRSA